MTQSARVISNAQERWARDIPRDQKYARYVAALGANLSKGSLHPETETEFRTGDGSELEDKSGRPAKMRALVSSSALAVNFFDPWRTVDKGALSRAFKETGCWKATGAAIKALSFEYQPKGYPVKPRSPNLDVMLSLDDGSRVGVESKFSEPYRSLEGYGALSARYFPTGRQLWYESGLMKAQDLADALRPRWLSLDVPQLLKHMLGLASDPNKPRTLLYVWFDTQLADAAAHRQELEKFSQAVSGDVVRFHAVTYQELFRAVTATGGLLPEGWADYMVKRYFGTDAGSREGAVAAHAGAAV